MNTSLNWLTYWEAVHPEESSAMMEEKKEADEGYEESFRPIVHRNTGRISRPRCSKHMREAKVRRKFAPLWEKQTLFLIRSSAKAGRVRLTNTKSRHARIEDDEWALGARSAYKKAIDLYPEYHWDLDVIIPKTREEVIRRFS